MKHLAANSCSVGTLHELLVGSWAGTRETALCVRRGRKLPFGGDSQPKDVVDTRNTA